MEIYRPYHKSKNLELSKKKYVIGLIIIAYLALWSGFGAYCYYKGVYHDLLYGMLVPFWSMTLVIYLMAALKKFPVTKATDSRVKIISGIVFSLFFLYRSLTSCYIAATHLLF